MYYVDDPDQLPELPDPGPRDGKHGVDSDSSYDPYPPVHFGTATGLGPLRVTVADAARHLAILVDRVENGDDVILTDHDHDVVRLMAVTPRRATRSGEPTAGVGEQATTSAGVSDDASAVVAAPREFEGEEQLPALPDPGPRDGRHGVDGTPPIKRRGRRLPR